MRFNVVFNQTDQKLPVKFGSMDKGFDASFEGFQCVTANPDIEYYTGSYEITPKVDVQTMPTAHKFMTDDVTVKAIPIFDVSNDAGGNTIFIASEV